MTNENDNSETHVKHTGRHGRHRMCRGRSNWNPPNILAMVAGFILFWPLGLFMVYWIMTGRSVFELPDAIRGQWAKFRGEGGSSTFRGPAFSDNRVFNEYQAAEMDRIRELKEELRGRSQRFNEWRETARRRADEEEFNRFMADSPINGKQ